MRLDPDHVDRLRTAIERKDCGAVETLILDHHFMAEAFLRLSLWERGLVLDALMAAAESKRPNRAQRALLSLFLADPRRISGAPEERDREAEHV